MNWAREFLLNTGRIMKLKFPLSKLNIAIFRKLLLKIKRTRGAKTTVGLDIGTNSIKVVELYDTPQGLSLVNFALAEIPSEVRKTQGAERIDRIAQLIRKNIIVLDST